MTLIFNFNYYYLLAQVGCADNAECKEGLECVGEGEERRCLDINECRDPRFSQEAEAHCGDKARCVNLVGKYRCRCHSGYDYWTANIGCEEVDECSDPNYISGAK